MTKLTLVFLVAFFLSIPSFACNSNFDCSMGSQCAKAPGSLYGTCVGGMNPGNSNDAIPTAYPMSMNPNRGNTCSSSFQCGLGLSCMKSGYSYQGVCQ